MTKNNGNGSEDARYVFEYPEWDILKELMRRQRRRGRVGKARAWLRDHPEVAKAIKEDPSRLKEILEGIKNGQRC